jgi:hypothetical protein
MPMKRRRIPLCFGGLVLLRARGRFEKFARDEVTLPTSADRCKRYKRLTVTFSSYEEEKFTCMQEQRTREGHPFRQRVSAAL